MKSGSRHLGKITGQHSRPFVARISRVIWTWRHLAAKVGTSKIRGGGQGSHNKPIGCGVSGAYAPGPDKEEEEEIYIYIYIYKYYAKMCPVCIWFSTRTTADCENNNEIWVPTTAEYCVANRTIITF
jgi:hypothetical protein